LIRDRRRNVLFMEVVSVKGRVTSVVQEYGALVERTKPVGRHRMPSVRTSVSVISCEAVGSLIEI
jgi:hypothetical protein